MLWKRRHHNSFRTCLFINFQYFIMLLYLYNWFNSSFFTYYSFISSTLISFFYILKCQFIYFLFMYFWLWFWRFWFRCFLNIVFHHTRWIKWVITTSIWKTLNIDIRLFHYTFNSIFNIKSNMLINLGVLRLRSLSL